MAEGTVLFTKTTDNGTYGFLIDDAISGHGDRATDVYFDKRSFAAGVTEVVKGQRVRFEYHDNNSHDERPRTKFKSIEPL